MLVWISVASLLLKLTLNKLYNTMSNTVSETALINSNVFSHIQDVFSTLESSQLLFKEPMNFVAIYAPSVL